MRRRALTAVTVAATALVAFAVPAGAHVTVQPGEATQGSFAKLAFRVPNESDTAATVKLEVQLPPEIESARTKPIPGWTATTTGSTITWEGGRIEPGEFQEFEISAGPLPAVDEVVFKAVQTYEDGEVARWIEEATGPGEELEHPAPVLRLVPGDGGGDDHAAEGGAQEPLTAVLDRDAVDQDDVDTAKTFGIAGMAVGALGLLAGLAAIVLSRRRP